MDQPWRIELLGELRAVRADRGITRFRTQKTGALLAWLAYDLERLHRREALIEQLWPEHDPKAGRVSLKVALSSLRHQLEPPDVPPGAILVTDRFSARLNPALVTTDVAEFDAALESAKRAGGPDRGQALG